MKRQLGFFLIAISILQFWGSCNLINPTEPIPSFIYIDSFAFTGSDEMGSSSRAITNVRVLYNNENLGVFDLPASIPIIASQPGKLSLSPGVTYSGINSYQVTYPFYTTDTVTFVPLPKQTQVIAPKTGYYDPTTFNKIITDFEFREVPFVTVTGDTSLTLDSTDVFEGKYASRLSLDDINKVEIVMNETFIAKTETYLELNYKCTIPFVIGIQTSDNIGGNIIPVYASGLRPSSEWKKVYIGLQQILIQYPNKACRLLIMAAPETKDGGYVLMDNIKILSRK